MVSVLTDDVVLAKFLESVLAPVGDVEHPDIAIEGVDVQAASRGEADEVSESAAGDCRRCG